MEYQLKTYLHQKLNQFSSLFRRDAPEMTTDQLLRMYSNSPWLRAVTNKIGQAVGTTDWRLFEPMTGNGRAMVERMSAAQTDPAERNAEVLRGIQRDDLRELTDHPALDMLRNGNEEFSGLLSMKLTQVYVDLVGEGFWLKERNRGGVPIAYWPLPSTWIRDLPRPDQPYFLIRADRTGEPTPVPIKEVVYIRDPNPARPYGRGTGIADSLGDELDIDDQSSKFIKSFFYNRARPDLIVHSDNFSREDAERVEKKWKEGHQGFWNQFKPLFINREVKIEQLSQSFESMQLSTMRQQERDVIINVFSVPPEKLGILSSCFDTETEMLTKRGWLAHDQLTYADEVATWSEDRQRLEYQRPQEIFHHDHDGPLHYYGGERCSTDVAVTPNHRMWVGTRRGDGYCNWRFMQSQELVDDPKQYVWRATCGGYEGENRQYAFIPQVRQKNAAHTPPDGADGWAVPVEDFAPFLGYWLAEGGMETSVEHAFAEGKFGIRLHRNEGEVSERMGDSMRALGMGEPRFMKRARKRGADKPETVETTWSVSSKSLFVWLYENTGMGALNKHLPREVFEWPRAAQEKLLDALIEGDGYSPEKGTCAYASSSKQLIDDMQQLAVQLGYRTTIYRKQDSRVGNPKYELGFSKFQTAGVNIRDNFDRLFQQRHYKGIVWCVQVPNSTVVTRRNGKVAIHGNSNRSTIDQADNFWEKDIVKPRVELLRSEIQRQLIDPDFGSGLLLHYQMPEYRDETLQSSLMRALPFAFLANDIRELAGKPSLGADGDFLMVPSNSQQVFVNPPSEQSRTALPDPRRQELRLKIRRALETPEGRRAVAGHVRRRLEDKRASAVIDDS